MGISEDIGKIALALTLGLTVPVVLAGCEEYEEDAVTRSVEDHPAFDAPRQPGEDEQDFLNGVFIGHMLSNGRRSARNVNYTSSGGYGRTFKTITVMESRPVVRSGGGSSSGGRSSGFGASRGGSFGS
jgi:uncharacterized membrane protein YgcG